MLCTYSWRDGWAGLRRTIGNRVYGEPYQGFESLSLRQKSAVILMELRRIFTYCRELNKLILREWQEMNLAQMEAAKKNMVIWLSDPHELGREPRKIEYAGNFELHDMRYYFFKFKTCLLGPWLIGVSGGYESDTTLEPCGHTFSNMKKYHASTAESDCIKMIEMIRAYWMEQAKRLTEQDG